MGSWAMTHAPMRFALLDHCSPLESGGLLTLAVDDWLLVIVASLYDILLIFPTAPPWLPGNHRGATTMMPWPCYCLLIFDIAFLRSHYCLG